MNPASTVPFPFAAETAARLRPRRRFRWRHVFLGFIAFVVVAILALVLSFLPGSDLRSLRNAALAASPETWDRRFELGVGRLPVLLAKSGLAFVPLEPNARAGIAAFESADIAIFHRRPDSPTPDSQAVFTRVRQAMDLRGWEPLALVREKHELVGVFVPRGPSRSSTLEACVLVMDQSDLVLVSARVDTDPLADLATAAIDRHPLHLSLR